MTTALQESTGNSWFRAHHIHTHPSTVCPAITETYDSTALIHVHSYEKWYFHCFAEYKHKNGFTFCTFYAPFFVTVLIHARNPKVAQPLWEK